VLELLVVIAITGILMSILVPALGKARRQVLAVVGAMNQKDVVGGVTLFSLDNDDDYPESVGKTGLPDGWMWSDPMKLIMNDAESADLEHRAMSGYLGDYITEARVMFCPNAPRQYEYLQESWEAGDDWDNPDTGVPSDPVTGTYCFYWNYTGFLVDKPYPFRGPSGPSDGRGRSTLLVSDYLGYDHWRSPGSYGSCDRFKGASVVQETWLLSAYWAIGGGGSPEAIEIKPRAGYTDGHVESFTPDRTVTMRVAKTQNGSEPIPIGVGDLYLPANSLR